MFQVERLERFAAAGGDWTGFEQAKAKFDAALASDPNDQSVDERVLLEAFGVTHAG